MGKALTAAVQPIGNMRSRFYFVAKGLVRWMWHTFHQLPPSSQRANIAQRVPESCSGGHTDERNVFEVATKPSGYCIGDGLTPGAASESCHVCQPHCSLWKKKTTKRPDSPPPTVTGQWESKHGRSCQRDAHTFTWDALHIHSSTSSF